jgi:hypothetical protein
MGSFKIKRFSSMSYLLKSLLKDELRHLNDLFFSGSLCITWVSLDSRPHFLQSLDTLV